ncbi:MAG: nucleoside-diphosphate sugar epimerase, partial [Rhodospirillaceae bacterium]|nr:nucleoside-diphosphate sugar epimerase [Rhodospirillaceae bacterium]MBT4934414.1 nucleoside-diphosphate sugar epimerase [Rhodospirillaceae bacterium]MBT5242858.1 nucleoside-diphosphate sugar epimerase [Rhodospirillaceae bacterium]MBT5243351.1 nucleoside-diphosphate sugar epimerase [Rhodospirillaceae bacterium]MBT5561256.1 nucleoside-diphosphate sugar epimerase [Rhodospirillaceae bacterium]
MTEFLLKSDIDEICQRLAIQAKDFSGKTVLLTGGRGFL